MHDLIGLKSKKRKYYDDSALPQKTEPKIFHWSSYTIAVFAFILNIAIQSLFNWTQGTNTVINIVVVILIVTGLTIYNYYLQKGGQNG